MTEERCTEIRNAKPHYIVVLVAAPGQRCLAERGMRVQQVHEQHTCSARGGGYTIRTLYALRVLGASVAASASYTIRTLRVLSASAAASASYTVRTLRVLRAALLRAALLRNTQTTTQTNTRHRCLFFIHICTCK